MTIAVFNKGVFVDFWLNEPSEKEWVERTIAAKGWLRQDVEVYLYEMYRTGAELLSFDDEKNLQVMASNIGQDANENPITYYTVQQTYNKIPYYLNGSMVE